VLCKGLIARPDLYIQRAGAPYHERGFDSSFPSGHALRAALLTAVIIYTWPVLKWLVLAWLAAVVLTLELNGVHTPSDVLGGLLLAFAFIVAVLFLTPNAAAAYRGGRGGRGTAAVLGRRNALITGDEPRNPVEY
jgi:membrane-associated phospholipid phosphatase